MDNSIGAGRGIEQSPEELRREIERRDRADSQREDSPLRCAPDAVRLDTTGLTIEAQVDEVVAVVRRALSGGESPRVP